MKVSNFFAILSHPGNRIRSISLTQEAQDQDGDTPLHIVDCLLAIMAQNQNLQLLSFDQELNKRKK